MNEKHLVAAKRLYEYIVETHWRDGHLIGPDPVGKIQWRITRFIRSYFPQLPNDDQYTYLQGMAYWLRANLKLGALTEQSRYFEIAAQCADYMVNAQSPDGVWLHPPIPGRRGFVSTVEGVWASLGLTSMYRASKRQQYLEAAMKWYETQVHDIGFQKAPSGLSANYYAHSQILVPNVTTMLIWLCAELFDLTGDSHYQTYIEPMIEFVGSSQLDSGELPYEYENRPHFMCYQYNSFEFLDLANYYTLTNDATVLPILSKLAAYLTTGVMETGSCRYNCSRTTPEVNYWTAALAAALSRASELHLGDYTALSHRGFRHLIAQQRPDGGFDFSRYNYRLLSDKRSYPRYLAMILYMLLSQGDEYLQLTGEPYQMTLTMADR